MNLFEWGGVVRIFRTLGCIAAATIAAMAIGHSANATIYTLSVDGCSGGCGTGPWGTVKVTQDVDNKSLDFSVVLSNTALYHFHENPDPNHHAFVFDLVGDPAVTITGLSTGFARDTSHLNASPFGTFDYAIDCTGCGHGFNGGKAGPLDFKVTPVAGALGLGSIAAELYTVQTKVEKIAFAVDIVNKSGGTGEVGAEEVEGVPELSTWAMMIIGFGGVALRLRRRGGVIAQAA